MYIDKQFYPVPHYLHGQYPTKSPTSAWSILTASTLLIIYLSMVYPHGQYPTNQLSPTSAWSILTASSLAAKPPNTREWMAPRRAVASIAMIAWGIIGMQISTLSPLSTPCFLRAPANRVTYNRYNTALHYRYNKQVRLQLQSRHSTQVQLRITTSAIQVQHRNKTDTIQAHYTFNTGIIQV